MYGRRKGWEMTDLFWIKEAKEERERERGGVFRMRREKKQQHKPSD